MDKKLIQWGFAASFALGAYIFLVAAFMHSANEFFGNKPDVLGVLAVLFLFVISAAVCGALILGKPALLYLDGKKKEGITLFGITLGWMVLFLIIIFAAMAILRW
jgi:hypothetical protein